MMMAELVSRMRREDYILLSAYFHAKMPRDRIVANCAKVLRHAMTAAGVWRPEFADAFHGVEEEDAKYPLVGVWYSSLISMTSHEPQDERLLHGAGNLRAPAAPHYTACWLTPAGTEAANRLLNEHRSLSAQFSPSKL
jgi:hypothetical protein